MKLSLVSMHAVVEWHKLRTKKQLLRNELCVCVFLGYFPSVSHCHIIVSIRLRKSKRLVQLIITDTLLKPLDGNIEASQRSYAK